MRVTKAVGAALLLLAVASFGAPVAKADAACTQACADRFFTEKAACGAALGDELAAIALEEQICINACIPTDYKCQSQCVKKGNVARTKANNTYRQCNNTAERLARQCYKDCQISPSMP